MVDNTYIIPTENGDIIYAPLSHFVHLLSDKTNKIAIPPPVVNIKDTNHDYEFQWGHLIVIPTQICNLNCSYCYAHLAHSRQIIKRETLQAVLTFLLSQKQERHKTISFIGGGEPLIAWDVIEWSILFLEEHKDPADSLDIFLTTNGTLLTQERIDFILTHNIHLEVSFDIIKGIQDKQRPFLNNSISSYASVIKHLAELEEKSIPYKIRTTITPESVPLMQEMVEQLVVYKHAKKIQFEPVSYETPLSLDYYKSFLEYFWKAREFGRINHIDISNSIIASIKSIRDQFCTGEFCVTPDGKVVLCHRASSPNDKLYALNYVGEVLSRELLVKRQVFDSFRERNKVPPRCKDCFARWHCAGFCPLEWENVTAIDINNKCWFIKENIKRALLESINTADKFKV